MLLVLTFESLDAIIRCKHWKAEKAIERYFRVVLLIMLYKVIPTFEFVDEILECDHSNESYWAVLSCGVVYYAVRGGQLLSLWMKYYSVNIQMKATEQ